MKIRKQIFYSIEFDIPKKNSYFPQRNFILNEKFTMEGSKKYIVTSGGLRIFVG
jgi:hypothetical protein